MAKNIQLNGQSLAVIDALPPGIYFDLVENFRENMVVASMKFLQAVVVKEDQERLRALLYDTENVVPWEELSEVATGVLAEYSGRPTERPSDSPTGSEATGQTSKVVSLSQATVREEEAPPTDGPYPESSEPLTGSL